MNSLYVLTNRNAAAPLLIRAESGKQARELAYAWASKLYFSGAKSWKDPKQTTMRRFDFVGTKPLILDVEL